MPTRLPDNLKRLRGTLRPCRTNPAAPTVDPCKVPPAPAQLTAEERVVWDELAPQVEALRSFAASDRTAFRLLVKVIAMVDHAAADMPATALVRLVQVASGLLQRFGLDPASRSKVDALPAAPAPSPLSKFSVKR